ncbi:hypothetical protein Tco_0885983 [Tanacetum coccineum]
MDNNAASWSNGLKLSSLKVEDLKETVLLLEILKGNGKFLLITIILRSPQWTFRFQFLADQNIDFVPCNLEFLWCDCTLLNLLVPLFWPWEETGKLLYVGRNRECLKDEPSWSFQYTVIGGKKAGTLTDEAIRNGSLKKNTEKRGNGGEPSRDRKVKDDNKRSRTVNSFATTANPGGGGQVGWELCGGSVKFGWMCKLGEDLWGCCDWGERGLLGFRVVLRSGESRGGLLGSEHRDGFVSTAFTSMLGIESSDLGFNYEIEIASSFDVIVGMYWLSKHKAEIICHEKVVRIPLQNGKILRVIGERPKEKVRHLRSAKTKERKKEDIVVVRNFPDVFLDNLSRLPPNQEIEFHIGLIPRAIPVTKSPYQLAPSEMKELPG